MPIQASLDGFLFCTPDGFLRAGVGASPAMVAAFESGAGEGFLHLAGVGLRESAGEPAAWARLWGKRFLTQLCQVRDPSRVEVPPRSEIQALIVAAPPMRGLEYLKEEVLTAVWEEMRRCVAAAIQGHREGFDGWLRDCCPAWSNVGRITFHFTENKLNAAAPFVFLATYVEQLSVDGRPQHTPLRRVLLGDQMSQAARETFLEPLQAAARVNRWLAGLLETRRVFQALAWTPQEAYEFLCQIPQLEECGLVVKLPDWWKGRRPPRPMVSVVLDAPEAGGVGVSALLSFNLRVTLGGVALSEEELKQTRASPSGLVNLRGQWVEVDQQKLQEALNHWSSVQNAHQNGTVSFHEGMRWLAGFPRALREGGEIIDVETGRDWAEVVAGKALEDCLERVRHPVQNVVIPGLDATLRPYQQKGVAWLHFATQMGFGVCLADDMGLGKTLQVIALLCLRKALGIAQGPSLFVVPASLLGNWRGELVRFAPHLKVITAHPSFTSRQSLDALENDTELALGEVDAVLTSYGLLQRSDLGSSVLWDLVVLDEAQAVKNPASGQARSVKKLKSHARVALTGTPVENRLGDLWSVFDFLNPGLLGGAGAFLEVTQMMAGRPDGYAPLRRLIGPYLLRRLKTDRSVIDDLPDKIEMQVPCLLSKRQAVLYARLVEQLKADLGNHDLEEAQRRGLVLGYLTKFKQVCNHPSQWSGDGKYVPEDSGKFLALKHIAGELAARQERCLVFTQFREMTEPLAAFLSGVFGRNGLVLHGGTAVGERQRLVEAFQRPDGPPFFVLSVKAGGTGLNLTAATQVIHFDRWWNPAVENQATDRAFRIGQRSNVVVHKFVSVGTIEEKVDALLRRKGALAGEILEVEGAYRQLAEMSKEDLLKMVSLDIHSVSL